MQLQNKSGLAIPPTGWHGSLLRLFQERPRIASFIAYHLWTLVLVYPAIVAVGHAWFPNLFAEWFALWAPIPGGMSRVLPIFDNFEKAFLAVGSGQRVGLVQHVLAYEWIVIVPTFAALLFATLRLPSSAWDRYVSSVRFYQVFLFFFCMMFFVAEGAYWIIFGFGFVNNRFLLDWYRSALGIPMIGMIFGAFILATVLFIVCAGALISGGWSRASDKDAQSN
jgi:hypothetical protein